MTEKHDSHSVVLTDSFGPLTRTDFVRFAGAGGDFNPLHHDDAFAKAQGFPSAFAMGIFTASIAAKSITNAVGLALLRAFAVRFSAPVWPGETLAVAVRAPGGVIAVQGADDPIATIEVKNEKGETKLTATARVGAAHASPSSGRHGGSQGVDPSTSGDRKGARGGAVQDELEGRIGEVLRSCLFPIEGGKIREFAYATKDSSEIYFSSAAAVEAGFANVPAPPTFSTAVSFYAGGNATDLPRGLGLDLRRLVHGEQAWTYHRAPIAGETLKAVTRLAGVGSRVNRAGNTMRLIRVETVFTDNRDALVQAEDNVMIELPARESAASEASAG